MSHDAALQAELEVTTEQLRKLWALQYQSPDQDRARFIRDVERRVKVLELLLAD